MTLFIRHLGAPSTQTDNALQSLIRGLTSTHQNRQRRANPINSVIGHCAAIFDERSASAPPTLKRVVQRQYRP